MKPKYIFKEITVNIDKIKPYKNNPRKITNKAKEGIKENIKLIGYQDKILLDKDMTIIAGHQRLRALKELGFTNIKASVATEKLTDIDFRKANVMHNAHVGTFDIDMLNMANRADELREMGINTQLIRDIEEINAPLNKDTEFAFSPELDEKSNYVVLKFDKDVDFLHIQTILGLKPVYSRRQNGKPWSRGIGRIIDGLRAIEILKNG